VKRVFWITVIGLVLLALAAIGMVARAVARPTPAR
jgi:hypothetical protein